MKKVSEETIELYRRGAPNEFGSSSEVVVEKRFCYTEFSENGAVTAPTCGAPFHGESYTIRFKERALYVTVAGVAAAVLDRLLFYVLG